MTKISVILADDHAIVRRGLRQILSGADFVDEIDEARDGQELVDLLKKKKYDCILVDISMPGRNGLEILQQIRHDHPDSNVLVLSIYPEDQYAIRAIKAGASGYLNKDAAPENLVEAVRKISSGGKYISDSVAGYMAEALSSNVKSHNSLSNREFDVFQMIASGKSVSEIASLMFLSVKTVSTYRRRILDKLGLRNNAEILSYAIRNKLVDE